MAELSEKKEKIVFKGAQKQAIDASGRTLMVSAGAGSGKTTVLTQRILKHLTEGVSVSDILVVTFLRSAAASLKAKLYETLLDFAAEHPDRRDVIRNIYLIPSARISTVDSFCLDLVRENFSALSLPPSPRMIDSCENAILLGSTLDSLIEKKFKECDSDLELICDNYSAYRSIEPFKKAVTAILGKYRALPFWTETVTENARLMAEDARTARDKGMFACRTGERIKAAVARYASRGEKVAEELENECSGFFTKESQFNNVRALSAVFVSITGLISSGASYTDIKLLLDGTHIPSKPHIKDPDFHAYYESMQDELNSCLAECRKFFTREEAAASELYVKMADIASKVNAFVIELDKAHYEAKLARGMLDFADIEQLALRLLGERADGEVRPTRICLELRERIKEIYIDEYQDINPLQDTLFTLISRPDNRFMVGDAKQSIYRFRNSSAQIFLNYLKTFPDLETPGVTASIYLNENHRCSKPIIDFVNLVFDTLYTEDTVGVAYGKERLRFPEDKTPDIKYPVEVAVFTDNGADYEKEASYTASVIKSLVDSGEYSYGDIAILMRTVKESGIVYRRALDALGIPYVADKKGSFLFQPEISLALAILGAVDDPLDDISLAAALRSPVFRLTAEDLYAVKRYYGYESLYACVRSAAASYARHHAAKHVYRADRPRSKFVRRPRAFEMHERKLGARPSEQTRKKCFESLGTLISLKRSAAECSGSRLIWTMYQKTGLIPLCAAEKNGEKRVANLYALYKYAIDYERTAFRGLSDFLAYLEKAAESSDFEPEAEQDVGDRVKILTVHQSKGMEYPVCFVSAAGKPYNTQDIKKKYIVSDSGELYCSVAEGAVSSKPAALLYEYDEEKRKLWIDELYTLYVALTRARDRLYVTGTLKTDIRRGFYGADSEMEWIVGALGGKSGSFFNVVENPEPLEVEKGERHDDVRHIPATVFADALSFGYPHPESPLIPAKAAVSELRKGILEDDEYTRTVAAGEATKIPSFADDGADAAAIGISTHLFMQFADFGLVESRGVIEEASRLVKEGMISEEDASRIDVRAIEKFFASPLCGEIKRSSGVLREKRFNLIEEPSGLGFSGDDRVMIQGVIDCFFENPDGTYTVVDYKTDFVRGEEGEKILADRHSFQLRYYCRAVERMTGARVTRALLYSFSLGREVEVPL